MENNRKPSDVGMKEFDYYIEIEEPLNEPMQLKLEKIKAASKGGKDLYSSGFDKNISVAELKKLQFFFNCAFYFLKISAWYRLLAIFLFGPIQTVTILSASTNQRQAFTTL